MSLALMVAFPFMGKAFVKYNAQVVLTICLVVSGLAFMAFSQCIQLWHFYREFDPACLPLLHQLGC
jgi:hypothetical protein